MPKPNWEQWEQKVAEDFGGRLTPGSGNKWFAKGDVRADDIRISCKSTSNNSFSVTKEDVREIEQIAWADLKEWAMALEINGRQLIVMDYRSFLDIWKKCGDDDV